MIKNIFITLPSTTPCINLPCKQKDDYYYMRTPVAMSAVE